MTIWTSVCDDVVAEVLAPTRVVQPRHGGTGQARTAERKDVVGRVVEQKTDVWGTARIEPGAEQRGKALRLRPAARAWVH